MKYAGLVVYDGAGFSGWATQPGRRTGEETLAEALEKVLSSKEHRERAEGLALQPEIIKGEAYRKFLKDNEQATKQLMGW